MKLINLNNGQILADKVSQAQTFRKRLKGLMFTKNLPSGCALHIQPCRSIHTFFMNYSIDVLHLDSTKQIIAIEEDVQPGHFGKVYDGTESVVELPAGRIQETNSVVGQAVFFKE